jgi:pectate lyase
LPSWRRNSVKYVCCLLLAAAAAAWMPGCSASVDAAAPADVGETSLPAFPGAEGFGASTPGGRGGRVMTVTNLNADGPGSLQAACRESGPRIVVFSVSGVIRGDIEITEPYITIAGQTAPGAGITIEGMLRTAYRTGNVPRVHDVVVRFLRMRPPPGGGAQGDAVQFSTVDRAVLDHLSCSWAEDETIDLFTHATNVTVQWCTVEESSTTEARGGGHNYGLITGSRSRNISIHHNLFVHQRRRNPAIGSGPADFRNNVVYNFRDGWSHEGNYREPGFNIIGNYYKQGPSDDEIFPFCFEDGIPYYLRDNYIEGVGMIQDPWAEADKLYGLRYCADKGVRQETETPVARVTTHGPQEAYELVLARAGCFPRDVVTRRVVRDVREGTGDWGRHETGDLLDGLLPVGPLEDTDSDGMPDDWERAHGLDSSQDDSALATPSGYTAIEEYVNGLAERLPSG